MFQWVQEHKWLPSVYLSSSSALLLFVVTYFLQGLIPALFVVGFCVALLFASNLPWIAISVFVTLGVSELVFNFQMTVPGFPGLAMVGVTAAFSPKIVRWIAFSAVTLFGIATVVQFTFFSSSSNRAFGLLYKTASANALVALLGSLFVILASLTFYMLGRLIYNQKVHVGSANDSQVMALRQRELTLEIAEQNQRFQIARDITEIVTRDLSAVLSQAGGGLYAAKVNSEAGVRALERIESSARDAHTELRRLHDMLNRSRATSSAAPGFKDLPKLAVVFRELGYNAFLRQEGEEFSLTEGAELTIYRIIFDALENVRLHVPKDSTVTVDLSWVADGLQVLIKDNGVETANRSATDILEDGQRGYSIDDDVRALVEPITGLGVTAMRERAALYGGSVEATRVPGVGFTLSVIFPMLRTLGGLKGQAS